METSKETRYYTGFDDSHIGRVSWPAIFAGTVIMLITLMLLSLLGLGIGLGAINPAEEARPFDGLGIGTLIWWVISNLIAVFAGAYVAANLTNVTTKATGIYHGLLSWSLYALISFWLMTTAVGGILSGAGGAVSKGLSAVGVGVSELSSATGNVDSGPIKQMIQDALDQDQKSGDAKRKEFDIDVAAVIQEVFVVNGQIRTDVERSEIERSVARNSTLSRQDVQRATDVILQRSQEAKDQWAELKPKVQEGAQKATDAASKAAIWAFVALLLGAITAAAGGKLGEQPEIASVVEKRKVT